MNRWPLVSLAEILEARKQRPDFGQIAAGKIKIVAKIRFSDGGVELRSEVDTKTGLIQCDPGDLLLSGINASKGAIAIWPENKPAIAATIHYAAYRVNQNISSARYMWWFLRSQTFREIISQSIPGGIKTELKPNHLLPIEIPLPPFDEQHAIIARLDAVAEKVRQVEAKLDEIEAEAASLTISLHHKLADGRTVRLGEVLEVHEERELIEPNSEYPQVGIRGFGGGLFAKPAVRSTETTYRAFNRLYTDAIVLSQVKGWEGALARCPESLASFYASPEYRTFRCIPDKASPAYMGELIKTPWFWGLLQNATRGVGARRERTRPEQFLAIKLPMPIYADQGKGAKVLLRLTQTRSNHAKTRLALQALLPSILEQIFN